MTFLLQIPVQFKFWEWADRTHLCRSKYVPQKTSIIGRSELEVKFQTVATYLEETNEQMTVSDLIGEKKEA